MRPAEEDLYDDQRRKDIRQMFMAIGENPDREGLKETPNRVIKAWRELCGGYKEDPAKLLTTFDGEGYDEMICCGPISFYSTCEHHLLPFFGDAWVAYVPRPKCRKCGGRRFIAVQGADDFTENVTCEECRGMLSPKIIGLSKLPRLVNIYARRLQNQERMTTQVTEALEGLLNPRGAACLVRGQHFCMMSRGVKQQKAWMTTSKLTGCFREPAARAEFFELTKER